MSLFGYVAKKTAQVVSDTVDSMVLQALSGGSAIGVSNSVKTIAGKKVETCREHGVVYLYINGVKYTKEDGLLHLQVSSLG